MEKIVKISVHSIEIDERTKFAKRWGVSFAKSEFEKFKVRIINNLREIVDWRKYADFTIIFSKRFGLSFTSNEFSKYSILNYLETLPLSSNIEKIEFFWILQNVINIYSDLNGKSTFKKTGRSRTDILAEAIAESLELSCINAVICRYGGEYLFYPKGADLLDQKIVNDNLNCLENYPDVREKFHDALTMLLKKYDARAIIDNMRLAFELFLRKFLGSDVSLENQNKGKPDDSSNAIGKYLKEKEVPKEIRNMYSTLLRFYSEYNNEHVKHGDTCSENEVEFMIYLTGTFIR